MFSAVLKYLVRPAGSLELAQIVFRLGHFRLDLNRDACEMFTVNFSPLVSHCVCVIAEYKLVWLYLFFTSTWKFSSNIRVSPVETIKKEALEKQCKWTHFPTTDCWQALLRSSITVYEICTSTPLVFVFRITIDTKYSFKDGNV